MSRVRSKNTLPEITVRKLVYNLGYRYRLHDKNLPGKPDLVFKTRKKVIFVNGCFWHRHENCKYANLPKSNIQFWKEKLEANKQRDLKNQKEIKKLGWKYIIVWECEVRDSKKLCQKLFSFLSSIKE